MSANIATINTERTPQPRLSYIYVVDDEELIAEVVETVLGSEGYRVKAFSNPVAALQSFSEEPVKPDMLVTDYVMGPLNGMELIRKCRDLHPRLLTLLYSGNVTAQITDLYAQKPHAFIAKPFQPKALVQLVQDLFARSAQTCS